VKRLLAVLVGLALALAGTMAVAAWLSTGSAGATASATSVNKANAPAATPVSGTVSLSWTASTLTSGAPVGGYRVLRHHGSDAPVEVCITTSPSCVDTLPLPGAVQYGVVATVGTQWTGPESDLTSFTFDDVAPVTTASVSPSPNDAGWNKTAVTVTLTATDSSGVDHISYTVDGGSLITVAGATRSFPVGGVGNHTVTYYAVDGVGNVETTNTLPVKIDPSAPVTTATPSPAANGAGWNNTNVSLAFSAVDVDASGVKSVTADGVTTNGSTANKTVTAEGTTTVSYFATDVADNVEGTKSTTVKIDKTNPTSSISPASSSSWIKQASQSVTINASDTAGPVGGNSGVASIVYSVDGGSAVTVDGTSANLSLGQGGHTIAYHAVDVAGNVQPDQSAVIRVDNVAPTNLTTSPATSTTIWRNSATVTFGATDATSGVAGFKYAVNSIAQPDVTTSPYSVILPEGTNTVSYQAFDNAGNLSGSSTATIKVDATKPTATLTQTGSGQPTLSGSDATSGIASVSWREGTGQFTTVTGSSTTLSLSEGQHTITYFATDSAGNAATQTSKTFTVDVTGPTITNVEPGNETGGWAAIDCSTGSNTGKPCATVTDNLTGVASVKMTLTKSGGRCWDGTSFVNGTCTELPMSLSGGVYVPAYTLTRTGSGASAFTDTSYTLAIIGVDNGGNTTTVTRTFTVTGP
jgi:hypothetical protein